MPGFDALAPDQKAVLQLLLKQGKSYDDIAGLLRLDRMNVRERALDALDALGAEAEDSAGLASERQDELADFLLLQQTASERASTRTFLEGSAPGRAWARKVAGELRPIGGDALPDIPTGTGEVDEAFDALDERTAARESQQKSSRLGAWLILGAIGAAIALGILLFVRSRGDDTPATPTQTTATQPPAAGSCRASTSSGATGATGAGASTLPQQQINLKAPNGQNAKALGYAIVAEGGLAFQATGLRASDFYKVWLWTSPEEAVPLGFAVYDRSTRRLAGAIQQLPAEADGCTSLVITREKSRRAQTPGTIILRGAIKRG